MGRIPAGIIQIAILFSLCLIAAPCFAIEPAWTFTHSEREIKGLAVAPDGSSVIVGTGKVLLLSDNGTLLANEPFGENIVQSGDGSTIVSVYSSTVSSTVYVFRKNKDTHGNFILQKLWENTQSDIIRSLVVSNKGEYIALSTFNKGINIYNGKTGKRLGHSDRHASLLAMSARGLTISGISQGQGLRVYTTGGTSIKKYDLTLAGEPGSFLMNTSGDMVVFNTGPQIIAFNLSNGSEFWKKRPAGDVNMLAMTPSGSNVVAGIENGAIESYDTGGNLTWTYVNAGMGGRKAINAVALTRDGSRILAGSDEGRIILLDSAGNLLWMYDTARDPVQLVAIAADGSLAAASTHNTIYAFDTGLQDSQPPPGTSTTAKTPSPTIKPENTSVTSPQLISPTIKTISTEQQNIPQIPIATITEYSVVRKTTQSPSGEMVSLVALLITVFLISWKKRPTAKRQTV